METLGYIFLILVASPFALLALMILGGIVVSIIGAFRHPKRWTKTVNGNSVTYSYSNKTPKND